MVFRLSHALLIGLVVLIGCSDDMRSKEKVEQAVMERLQQHSGLDLNALDVSTTDVNFEKNQATANVAFHPKGDPAVNSGMTMQYTLEIQNGKWVVINVKPAVGSLPGAGQLPFGHPSVPDTQKQ